MFDTEVLACFGRKAKYLCHLLDHLDQESATDAEVAEYEQIFEPWLDRGIDVTVKTVKGHDRKCYHNIVTMSPVPLPIEDPTNNKQETAPASS